MLLFIVIDVIFDFSYSYSEFENNTTFYIFIF